MKKSSMKKIVFPGLILLASLGSASAADPIGEWTVEDGVARIRIVDCNTRLWGVISWEKDPGGVDAQNPDRSKQSRPTLGIPILLNMQRNASGGDPDQWEGKVYNAENGKLYDSKIKLVSQNKLELKGCVLGFLCGGQTWTRYIDPTAPMSPQAGMAPMTKAPASKGKAPTTAGMAKGMPSADPATAEVCSLPEIAGAAH
jgi:uncharacterized protein (DUF2147 family)